MWASVVGRSLAILCILLGIALGTVLAPRPALGGAFAPAPRDWQTVTKATDETISSDATYTADSALSFSMAASTKYRIRGVVWMSSDSTADFKFRPVGPASPTYVQDIHTYGSFFAGVVHGFGSSSATSYYAGTTINVDGSDTNGSGIYQYELLVHNGSNSGTFAIEWAQGTSNASNTTVKAGSYLEYKAVQ